ncbi:O-antigen ligase family protein [Rhodospirillum rubrum]|uniref:O-antigen polymerase n=1 Tax=Rhodospirillum rubrum (strain ATCC 11170 / ATH 1.1.1 / DSM 467 / LMG 4362 / NCIMB 8255 / S1) TaxID=269796 RepID=Q2RSI1_RHORT|nr:O-antigen ligase family protein [Rhodospirillum rubrum]ABC22914.1 O-antigen polymerase [Rhodospirillum rubrum ATCC 11170]AEO48638.1 O-antigen polymerase [Rhodospirillum rubrum F11]MBK5954531.1 O-antigen polymerase [Rhodospirillum rubrum]QXG78900.1 O-antigen polymerase [Rhodospirillum rubrum]HCF16918.1 O-antigen polymerase [Rhodospirillum rubrum]
MTPNAPPRPSTVVFGGGRDWAALAALAAVPLTAALTHSQLVIPVGLIALLGLVTVALEDRPLSARLPLRSPFLALGALIALWGLLSLGWTPTGKAAPRDAWTVVAIVLGTPLCARLLARPVGEGPWGLMPRVMATVLGLCALLVFIETYSLWGPQVLIQGADAPVAKRVLAMNGVMSVLSLLVWPTALALWIQGRRRWAIGLAVVVALAVARGTSEASLLGLCVGGLAFALALLAPVLVVRLVSWGMAVVMVASPLVIKAVFASGLFTLIAPHLGFSVQHRLLIWRFIADRLAEKPWMGWGIAASRSFQDLRVPTAFHDGALGWVVRDLQIVPIHPHNMPLQLWFELGVVGVVPVLIGLGLLGWRLGKLADGRLATATVAGLLASGLTMAMGTYNLWQGWVLCAAAVAGCLMAGALATGRQGRC